MAAAATEKKFIALRKRLDQLGYRQPLGMESYLLVDRLFADLVQTTDSLRKAKKHANPRGDDANAAWTDAIGAYKAENARLVRENNDLHAKLLAERETLEERVRELRVTLRRVEHENADLKFLNSQYVHRVRAHERQSAAKDGKIVQLQEKNVRAVIETPGGRKKPVAFRKQRMDVEAHVPPAAATAPRVVVAPEPFLMDMMKMADLRNEQMSEKIVALEGSEKASARAVQSLRKQVEVRNAEIERLHGLLDGGRPLDVMIAEGQKESNEKMVAHLNIQVDYLTQVNSEMASKMKEMESSQKDAELRAGELASKNARLCGELEEINDLTRQLEEENAVQIKQLEVELRETKDFDERRVQLISEFKKEIRELKRTCHSLELTGKQNAELAHVAENDVRLSEERCERIAQEKREVEARYEKLQEKERDLTLELERLRHIAVVREEDRARRSRTEHARVEDVVIELEERVEELVKEKAERIARLRSIETMHGQTEDERNYYKSECEKLQRQLLGDGRRTTYQVGRLSLSPMKTSFSRKRRGDADDDDSDDGDGGGGGGGATRLKVERDRLRSIVDQFEKELIKIKTDTGILTSERDNFKLLYDQASDEVRRLRRDLAQRETGDGRSPLRHSTQVLLRQVEQERDDARRRLAQLQEERDRLQERLRMSTESEKANRDMIELKSVQTETDLKEVVAERDELANRIASLRDMVARLEEQLKTSSAALTSSRTETATHESRIGDMRAMVEEAERSRREQGNALADCRRALNESEEKVHRRELELRSAENEIRSARAEESRLRGVVETLDRERDALQAELDSRMEQIICVQEEKDMGSRTGQQLNQKIRDLESQMKVLTERLASKDREIASLRHERDVVASREHEARRGREIAVADNRRLEQDLRTMTDENQTVHRELTRCQESLQEQNEQLQLYAQQLLNYKDMMDEKEDEKVDLLKSYQSLSSENEKLESSAHQTLRDAAGVQQQLLDVTMENQHLQQQYHLQAEEIGEKEKALHAYGLQVSKFSSALSRMEQELRQTRDEKRALLEERNASRALCSKLEQDKAVLMRQVATRGAEVQQLKITLDNERMEVESLRREVERLNQRLQGLESVLAVERQTVFQHEARRDRTTTENRQLHEQIIQLETERHVSLRELSAAREEIKKASLSPGEVSPASSATRHSDFDASGRRESLDRLPDDFLQGHSDSKSLSSESLRSGQSIGGEEREETHFEREKKALEEETASVVDELMSSRTTESLSPPS